MAEEESGTVDRAAILVALQGAVEVKLEGRIVPVVRSLAEGISQAHTLAEKVRRWAEATGVEVTGLLARLERMESTDVEQIVLEIARAQSGATGTEGVSQDETADDAIAAAAMTQ